MSVDRRLQAIPDAPMTSSRRGFMKIVGAGGVTLGVLADTGRASAETALGGKAQAPGPSDVLRPLVRAPTTA